MHDIRTNPSGDKYCYTCDSATVPLRASCAVFLNRVFFSRAENNNHGGIK